MNYKWNKCRFEKKEVVIINIDKTPEAVAEKWLTLSPLGIGVISDTYEVTLGEERYENGIKYWVLPSPSDKSEEFWFYEYELTSVEKKDEI